MKALVIGSEGNVGRPLVRHLRASQYEVLEVDVKPGWTGDYLMADINQPIDLLPAFDWGPDVVFLLSAMVSRVTCEQAAGLAVATNLGGINNVLQMCKRARSMCIFFSTSEVYGPECDPMDEAVPDPMPNNRYGLTKLLGEKLVEYEVRTHGLHAMIIRPFMIYDENEDLGDHRSAMIRFAWRLADGRSIRVHRGSIRGWMHVTDAVRAIEAATRVDKFAIINIGHPEFVHTEELAEMIRDELGASLDLLELENLPERMTLVKRPLLELQGRLLGFQPTISLAEGVKRVCQRTRERLVQGAAKCA